MSSVSWEELKAGVREAFSTERVDIDHVQHLLRSYRSRREDWKKFALVDPHKYTRNLVDEGNGRYNLIVLCWGEGHGSSIHDHTDSHCFMKVLAGGLKESLYPWPSVCQRDDATPMQPHRVSELYLDEVTYINDSIGVHRVENPSHTDPAVSLHVYSPPILTCNSYEERTGCAHKCNVCFYSKEGLKVEYS